jgi:hypothetical protein
MAISVQKEAWHHVAQATWGFRLSWYVDAEWATQAAGRDHTKISFKRCIQLGQNGSFFRMEPSKTLTSKIWEVKWRIWCVSLWHCVATWMEAKRLKQQFLENQCNRGVLKNADILSLNCRYLLHGKGVLLLVDTATCHLALDLTNVCVEFLPENTTSFLQSLDAGIIQKN